MGLNSEQLAELGRYVAVNDRAGYYELLSSYGVDYGTQALGVVDADTLSGAAANIFLKWTAQETSAPISNETLARLSVELLKADYAARSVSGGVRWTRLLRQFGGLAKVDRGCFYAANCSVISAIA